MDYEAKSTEYTRKIQIYLSVSTNDINPIEIKQDLDIFKEYLLNKYTNNDFKPEEKPKCWLSFLNKKNDKRTIHSVKKD